MDKLNEWIKEERGRLARLSEELKIKPQSIIGWSRVPAEYCLRVEEFTGISRYHLRPDVYGEPAAA